MISAWTKPFMLRPVAHCSSGCLRLNGNGSLSFDGGRFNLVHSNGDKALHAWWLLDYFFAALVVTWLAAFQWAVLCWLVEKAGK